MTPTNHLFERVGKVVLQGREGVSEEDVYLHAIEAGCTDIESTTDGNYIVFTEPQETASVAEAIVKAAGLQVLSTDIIWASKEETQVEESPSGPIAELVGTISAFSFLWSWADSVTREAGRRSECAECFLEHRPAGGMMMVFTHDSSHPCGGTFLQLRYERNA